MWQEILQSGGGSGLPKLKLIQQNVPSPSLNAKKNITFDGKAFMCMIQQVKPQSNTYYIIIGYYRETEDGFRTCRTTGGEAEKSEFFVPTQYMQGGIENLVYDESTNKTTVTFTCSNNLSMILVAWVYDE